MRYLLSILLSFIMTVAFSQQTVDSSYVSKFQLAKSLMDDSLYFKANEVFMDDLMKEGYVLPDEICFQFGKSLFYSGYKDQSKNFLYKYLELIQTDTTDMYFQPTIDLLQLLGEDVNRYVKSNALVDSDSETESVDGVEVVKARESDCNSDEVFICPVCNGTTVLVRKGSFGNTYQTCPYCNEDGIMDCHSYQLYLKGELFSK